MNPSTTALTLNMQLPNIAAVSWAVQGDQLARRIQATLVDGSTPWTPEAGYSAVVRYHKPDGTSGVYDVDEDGNPAVSWVGNVATVAIVQQALTVPGTVLMQLEFYDSGASRITAFGWANNVQPSAVTDTEFLSTDYYNLLTLQIAGVLGASGHPPYINSTSKNWMVWNENTASYIDSGFSSVGMTGPAPTVTNTAYQYANSDSGTVAPTSWSNTRPETSPGTWAWTKTTITFDNNTTTTTYSAAYQGLNGTGSVNSVNSVNPGSNGNVAINAANIPTTSATVQNDLDDLIARTNNLEKAKLVPVTINITASETYQQIGSATNADINANSQLVYYEIADPSIQVSDWSVITYDTAPQVRVMGSASGASTIKIILAEV